MIGWCNLTLHPVCKGKVDLYYSIDKKYQGQNYSIEAGDAILKYAFSTIGLPEIVAVIDTANIPSLKVVEKLGFRYKKTLKNLPSKYRFYNDQLYYSLTRSEYLSKITPIDKYPQFIISK
jgi:RimJ/RimL family protein N-acetyltransferase